MNTKRATASVFRRWWREIDMLLFVMILSLIALGAMLILTSSPAIATRIGAPPFHFFYKHVITLIPAICIIWYFSIISEQNIKKVSLFSFIICIFLLCCTIFYGDEVKGAKRWIGVLGFTLQPSELLKPFLAVLIAVLLAEKAVRSNFPGFVIASIVHCIAVALILLQPDFGMTVSITAVTASQFFVAGLSMFAIVSILVIGVLGLSAAYFFMPHVAKRFNSFLDSNEIENYQVEKSLESYINGGIFGRGPGEGVVKHVIPDAHTDFIFAVAGEELGAIASSAIILLFCAIATRGIRQALLQQDHFYTYAIVGLIMHFAFQAVFNIGVTLHLLPTKGMTLPFISYGGSSLLSFSIVMGMVLNLTKKRYNTQLQRLNTFST